MRETHQAVHWAAKRGPSSGGDEFVPHQDLNKREAVAAADNSLIFVNETEQSQRISKASGGFGPLDP
ncbi:MAG TPA: hypothetical protein VNK89_05095, partial [Thermoflexus sp.]|nr:hypothetical protein [Thermoflexus sp.]